MPDKQWVHFIGIGGAGMSGIAKCLLELGYHVTGSDLLATETTKRLENWGARIFTGHRQENLDPLVDLVVVSSAIPKDNAELMKAVALEIPVIQRAEMLGRLMEIQKGIAVAGAHGKTTTTSMISLMLEKNGYDPTVVVGGELNDIGGNAKLGKGEYLVAEADESDGSFLKLKPFITVVTNVEDDHLDYYGTRENIEKAFRQFIKNTHPGGFSVLCFDDPVLQRLIPGLKREKRIVTYGFNNNADFYADDAVLNGHTTKTIIFQGRKRLGEIHLSIPGKHNLLNALAAVAVGINAGLSFEGIACSLQPFRGVQRRFQVIGEVDGIAIYDDYAHHPTELKTTLAAARTLKPGRIVAVFQPHRYTRTQLLAREFGSAFRQADVLIVNEVYSAGEKPIPGVSAKLIVDQIKESTGQEVEYIQDKSDIVKRLGEIVRPGDLVITMGAGNIWTAGVDLYRRLGEKKGEVKGDENEN
ncbi:MAG: UDP-N-acetylmuramate--L-alanine ligase [Peptococcaceae bacterium]|jgi:UDP-N-acetylmuramate--alanine ligase|nr:UDP-N-acetylmuramate--L-alanine ligase [Peptococcaceae bacterium]MDH7524355.1 UDP-N-acetylmuramate--L-alanine ligase [Peptococcaceae bacterium]